MSSAVARRRYLVELRSSMTRTPQLDECSTGDRTQFDSWQFLGGLVSIVAVCALHMWYPCVQVGVRALSFCGTIRLRMFLRHPV